MDIIANIKGKHELFKGTGSYEFKVSLHNGVCFESFTVFVPYNGMETQNLQLELNNGIILTNVNDMPKIVQEHYNEIKSKITFLLPQTA